jgi:hypothetical protein
MQFQTTSTSQKRNKVMTPEQFKQVVEAITEGRYSWACVLILRFAGYNPIHFIPHRTYSRLLKENRLFSAANESSSQQLQRGKQLVSACSDSPIAPRGLTQINELTYQETVDRQDGELHGGNLPMWFEEMVTHDLFDRNFLKKHQLNYFG